MAKLQSIKANMESVKKPSKSLLRMCKILTRVGRWMRKMELTSSTLEATPIINVSEEVGGQFTVPEIIPAEPATSRFLSIPTSRLNENCGLASPSSPSSPKGPASYPPTPDYVKFPSTGKWPETASTFGDAFFPHDSEVEKLQREDVELRDWAVNYVDLDVKAKIQQNATGDIYKGQWHGNVLIYKHTDRNSIDQFMADVEKQSKIRHENVLLFLGCCYDELAIVLHPPKQQQSVHQLLNSPRRLNKLPHNLKWNLAQQLAQAVSYLHAKDVCVGPALHSGNVFLEAKIKLSLVDFGFAGPADVMFPRVNTTTTRNYLTSFLAPEILALFNSVNSLKANCNAATDSFAFGSLLYEIFTEQKPFLGLSHSEQLEFLETGDFTDVLDRPDLPLCIQKVIAQCWRLNPLERPTFSQILESLNRKPYLLSRHSSSQPDLFSDVAGSTKSKSFN